MARTRLLGLAVWLASLLAQSGCHSVHTPDESCTNRPVPSSLQNDHEIQVRTLITDLWTSDNQLMYNALARSSKLLDERVANALIGKLWEAASYTPVENYQIQWILDGIRAQGYSVEITPTHYIVKPHPESRFPPPIPHPPQPDAPGE